MAERDAYSQYRETQIMTASQGRLVVMLYEGALRFIDNALAGIEAGKLDQVNSALLRAQDIITELALSINFDAGDLASKLYNLYMYFNKSLLEANIRKDVDQMREVRSMLESMLDAWRQIADKAGPKSGVAAVGGVNIAG